VRALLDRAGPDRVAPEDPLAPLTTQERRVALAVATGATNHEVAEMLFLSVRTVEFHLSNVFRKLGLHRRSELAHLVGAGAEIAR
jgi:DNA-binding NarL/FixJ family response regulator